MLLLCKENCSLMMNQFCHLGPMIVMIVSIAVSILGTATIAINCYAMTMPKRWKATLPRDPVHLQSEVMGQLPIIHQYGDG